MEFNLFNVEGRLTVSKTFDLLYARDKTFREEMGKTNGEVKKEDWTYVTSLLPLLDMFYKYTNHLFGSLYVTSASYMVEVFSIGKWINKHLESDNEHKENTAEKMKHKFNKYWGNPDTISILLLTAFVLDPRVKLSIAEFYISLLYADIGKVDDLKNKLKSCLSELYAYYRGVDDSQSSQLDTPPNEDDDDNIFYHYSQETRYKYDLKSEIESYLQEACVPYNKGVEFNIFGWWKANLTRYPILASIAREVLVIPASTIASESAFSTDGRVVSDYLICLTPKMVEAPVCT